MNDPISAQPLEKNRRLCIFIDQEWIGTVYEENAIWSFVYDEKWAIKEGSFDLSPALLRSQLIHRDEAIKRPVQWYFDNLLPEEDLRALIAANAKIGDANDSFALLEFLGAESAGSLTLLPPGHTPWQNAALKPLSYSELSRRIFDLPKNSLTNESPKRMALAGAQHKLMTVLQGADFYEPVCAALSTHILKPDHPEYQTYPASTYLEWITMRLAKAAGLEVPQFFLLTVPQPVYVIERFDRRINKPQGLTQRTGAEPADVERVHIIDACQLLNKSRAKKYSGASVQALFEIAKMCGDELTLPPRLFRWLVFNLLMGNDDCHLKNLSFLVSQDQLNLSPHYDLLATGIYHTRAFADDRATWPAVPLAVRLSENVTRFDQITPSALIDAARELSLSCSVATQIIDDVIRRTLGEFDAIFATHYPDVPKFLETNRGPHGQQNLQKIFDVSVVKDDDVGNTGRIENVEKHQVSALVQAQQLKILRVLRFVVLPEMSKRLTSTRPRGR